MFGGRSPINDQNKALIAALEADLAATGVDLPVYWGNRNWEPYLVDAVRQMAADGRRRVACVATSAYSSWSSCRQYRDNIEDAVAAVPDAPQIDKVRWFAFHPGLRRCRGGPDDRGDRGAAARAPGRGPPGLRHPLDPDEDERRERARRWRLPGPAPRRRGRRRGAGHRDDRTRRDHELVFCSRSGSPHTPWLEPDVNDRLEELRRRRASAGRAGPRGVRLGPHGGGLRPRHRGPGHRGAAGHARPAGPGPPASTRASWPRCASSRWTGPSKRPAHCRRARRHAWPLRWAR